MARLLVLGTGPLLEPGATVVSGQCLRTWHFAAPLLRAGHTLSLLTAPIPGATREDADPPYEEVDYRGQRTVRFLTNNADRLLPHLLRFLTEFRPDGIVGVNPFSAYLLARLRRPEPFWADLNGWTMAEGLTRAAVVGHDRDFGHFWKLEASTLLAADRFSTVTERQAHALYGELAMLGRLGRHNMAEPFAVCVPNAIYPDFEALERRPGVPDFLRDAIPSDALLALWSGGFNTWTDSETLLDGLARALAEEPRLHFVITGGAIPGHDEVTWNRFEEGARRRLPAGRWHALGWTDFPRVLALHAAAHVGLNMDGDNIETRFGARNRVTNMLGAGMPVVTTRGTEVAEWMERHGLGRVVAPRDAGALAGALLEAVRDPAAELQAAAARRVARAAFAPENTLGDFLRWAEKPSRSMEPIATPPGEPSDPAGNLRTWVQAQADAPAPLAGSLLPPPPPPRFGGFGIKRRLRKFFGGGT